jgi:hypothetical protein
MKRISYTGLSFLAACILAAGAVTIASDAFATPNPTGAVLALRIFNDCGSSILSSTNAYPSYITIADHGDPNIICLGFTNFHGWDFSEDGSTPAEFPNASSFDFQCDMVMNGGSQGGEAGLRIGPWWSPETDGLFNCKTVGEIACFSGRLPFYSFTSAYGINYSSGALIHLGVTVKANGLSMVDPATIEYKVILGGTPYTSGPIAFDQGNPAEDPPHGQWGILNTAHVGGQFKALQNFAADPRWAADCTWSNISYTNLDVTPTKTTTWGKLKSLYR